MKKTKTEIKTKNKIKVTAILFLFSAIYCHTVNAQSMNYFSAINWSASHLNSSKSEHSNVNSLASHSSQFFLNIVALTQRLQNKLPITMSLPLPNGRFVDFKLTHSTIMPLELAEKYPNIRTFDGVQVNNSQHRGKFDITPQGFHGVFNYQHDQVFIDPIYQQNNKQYHSYFRRNAIALTQQRIEKSPQLIRLKAQKSSVTSAQRIIVADLKTYRIAVAATGEYTRFHGGTKSQALAAIVTMLNRINEVYEQDVAITFELVAQEDTIIFTDPNTDPYDNTDNDLDANTTVINNAIGTANYDIGHVVGTGSGGLASLGVVCTAAKAQGVTGSNSPTNDAFYIDFVAHEIGHQFNANHTFNGTSGACAGNRVADSAYEVGSASTIMGYAGICGEQNLQNHSDPYFHIHSIDQILAFSRVDQGKDCGSSITKTNQAPVVNAGKNYTIPARTPFMLTGSATDKEQDKLSYDWEEFDLGAASTTAKQAQTDDGSRPLFRNFVPQSIAVRSFPKLADIVSNKSSFSETLPTTTRDLNFRLIVRDDQGNLADDAMKISVIGNNEGFHVIEPSADVVWNNDQQTITWFTAKTELLPVNCSNVDIWLSKDAGQNFDWLLAKKTANNGSAFVNLPQVNTTQGRIKIACSSNVFFALNPTNISINSMGSYFDSKPEFISQVALSVNEDNSLMLAKNDFSFVNNLHIDSLVISAGKNYTFSNNIITPASNFNGSLSVIVKATKGDFVSDTFIATVQVIPVNDPPIAVDDDPTVLKNSNDNNLTVLANDSDIENDPLTIISINYNGGGSAVIKNNTIIYTPASNFSGTELLSYSISDGHQGVAKANVTITVPNKTSNSSGGGGFGALLSFWLIVLWRKSFLRLR